MGKVKNLLCYDISTCPPGMSLDRVLSIMNKHNILLFNSSGRNGHLTGDSKPIAPYILNKTKSNKVRFFDTINEIGRELVHNLTKN